MSLIHEMVCGCGSKVHGEGQLFDIYPRLPFWVLGPRALAPTSLDAYLIGYIDHAPCLLLGTNSRFFTQPYKDIRQLGHKHVNIALQGIRTHASMKTREFHEKHTDICTDTEDYVSLTLETTVTVILRYGKLRLVTLFVCYTLDLPIWKLLAVPTAVAFCRVV